MRSTDAWSQLFRKETVVLVVTRAHKLAGLLNAGSSRLRLSGHALAVRESVRLVGVERAEHSCKVIGDSSLVPTLEER